MDSQAESHLNQSMARTACKSFKGFFVLFVVEFNSLNSPSLCFESFWTEHMDKRWRSHAKPFRQFLLYAENQLKAKKKNKQQQ